MRYFLLLSLYILTLGCAAEQSFHINHHYFKAKHIPPQKELQIHYFFSFQCPGCGRLYPILEPYFHENVQDPIFLHPMTSNQAGAQLIKAYELLTKNHQGQQYVRALYKAPSKNNLSDKEIFKLMKNEGHENFEQLWNTLDTKALQTKMTLDITTATHYKLSALPMIYIIGPKGAYYIHPSPDLPLTAIPSCIEAVIELQKKKS